MTMQQKIQGSKLSHKVPELPTIHTVNTFTMVDKYLRKHSRIESGVAQHKKV